MAICEELLENSFKTPNISLHLMAKSVELQEINFKTSMFLSAIKRGATKMFCHEVGGPPTKSLRAPQKARASLNLCYYCIISGIMHLL